MARSISNSDRVIDSRNVIARIEELQGERDDYAFWADPETRESDTPESRAAWAEENPDDAAELAALEALAVGGRGLWRLGERLSPHPRGSLAGLRARAGRGHRCD